MLTRSRLLHIPGWCQSAEPWVAGRYACGTAGGALFPCISKMCVVSICWQVIDCRIDHLYGMQGIVMFSSQADTNQVSFRQQIQAYCNGLTSTSSSLATWHVFYAFRGLRCWRLVLGNFYHASYSAGLQVPAKMHVPLHMLGFSDEGSWCGVYSIVKAEAYRA